MPVSAAASTAAAVKLMKDNRLKYGLGVLDQHKEAAAWESEEDFDVDSKKLRARKLASLANKELTNDNLRALFRLLDDDGSHEVSPAEIQRGLLLLGFESASDPVALSRLLVDIDEDKTGTITESEFMGFFNRVNRAQLKQKLDSYVIERAFITATFYGTAGGKPTIRTEIVSPSRLRDWLNSLPPNRGRLWLDVVGYDSDAHAVLAEALGMECDDVCANLLFQQPTLAITAGPLGPRANIILHSMSISVQPIVSKPKPLITTVLPGPIGRCCARVAGIETDDDELLGHKMLIPKAAISKSPPAISLEQAALIVVDERTIVTLRAPAFDGDEDNTKFKTAAVVPVEDTLANDTSVIRSIYDDIRSQMAGNSPNVSHLFTGSVKALAVVLVDSILAHNYSLRDGLQDWDEVLSKDIRKSPASLHTPHLEAIRVLTESFERALQPLCTALNPQEWDKEDEGDGDAAKEAAAAARSSERALVAADAGAEVAAHDGGGGRAGNAGQRDSTSSNPVASQASRGAGDDQTSVTIASSSSLPPPVRKGTRVAALATHPSFKSGSMRSVVSAQMDNAPSGDGSSGAARVSLKQFFRRQASEFMELSQDLQSMVNDMSDKKQGIESNRALLASLKADMMNRTLYALTLLTAVSVPITFLTGLWGMNFTDMTELDPDLSEAQGLPMGGYRIFWTTLMSTVVGIVLGMWRGGLFKALQ